LGDYVCLPEFEPYRLRMGWNFLYGSRRTIRALREQNENL